MSVPAAPALARSHDDDDSPDDAAAAALAALVDGELARLAPDDDALRATFARVLAAPARDLLARPSKQLRAALVGAGWALAGGDRHGPPPALLAAIEILHAGSLAIDDIEDDAELRRGEPALHRRYGTPIALNTGNWMYFWAFALLDRLAVPDATRLALHRAMLRATLACHEGQALDLGVDITAVPRDRLRAVVARATELKSGALVALAMQLGAIAARADARTPAPAVIPMIGELGRALGVGLQMLDDLGSVTSAARITKAREDLVHRRPTWTWVWASERADAAAWTTLGLLADAAAVTGDPTPLARALAPLAAHGRAEIRAHLAAAVERIRPLAHPDALAAVERELHRLEASYGC